MSNNVTTELMMVSPEQAEEWLAVNTSNRNLREAYVRGLAADMEAGNWQWNGDSIKFAADGTLLDGQHRLNAIVRSGKTIQVLVIEGLPSDTQDTMDTGRKRTLSDALKLRGEKNYAGLASGLRSCYIWDQGSRKVGSARGDVTNSRLLDYLEENPELREHVLTSYRVNNQIKIPPQALVIAIKVLTEIDREDADYFFERLRSSEDHHSGEPIHELRELLLREQAGLNRTRTKRDTTWKLAVIFKAWNKYRLGEITHKLYFSPGGAKPEKFPEPF